MKKAAVSKTIANEIRKGSDYQRQCFTDLQFSALFKGSAKIDTLDDALIILGRDVLVKSILLAAINNYFSQAGSGYALCYGGLVPPCRFQRNQLPRSPG